jgi:UDP-3-O-[3-hydroxymyristoyl] glucosamine N-acyltransferase
MNITIKDLALLVNGNLDGNGQSDEVLISRVSPIEEAKEGSLSFLHLAKYNHYLYATKASAVLVSKDFVPEQENHPPLIFVDNVYDTFMSLLERFNHFNDSKIGIEEPVYISKNVTLGENIYLGAFSYIGKNSIIGNNVKIYPNVFIGDDVQIGDNTVIYAGVKVYHKTEVGKNNVLHSGCVIGSDGFGFAPQKDGTYNKIPQVGRVILKDYVEVGANTTIDRATMESTIIQKGVKLDNLIQIAHNVEIGDNTVIAGQTGVSGSTKIGKQCVIGGQVGFAGHIEIADGSQFGAQSGVAKSVKEENGKWFGTPIMPVNETLKLYLILQKMPELYRKINAQEKEISRLKELFDKNEK